MGEYEIHVGLPEAAAAAEEAPAAAATVDIDLSDPDAIFEEPTYVGGSGTDTKTPTPLAPAAKPAPAPQPKAPAPPRPKPAAPVGDIQGALRVFLEGGGMAAKDLSAADSERLPRDSGAILRSAVEGLMMLLVARAEMRKEMQAEERTMVAAHDNNPLKLMSDPHEAM